MMNMMKIAGVTFLAAVAAAVATPAAAQTTFNFKNTTNSALIGAPGNSLTFYNSTNTISVKVTAWSVTSPTATPQAAYLGWYDHGLGVTNTVTKNPQGEWVSDDNSHTIDNVGKYDFVTLEFSTYVQLRTGVLTPFDVTNNNANDADNDVSVSFTSGPAGSFLNAAQQADLKLHTTELSGNTTAPYSVNLNPGGNTGNIWTIGADRLTAINSDMNDGFKLTSLTVQIPTPEPASWAMMIGGFGVTGASLRRRRSQAGAVATA